MANYIANHYFKNRSVFYVNALPAGSCKTDDFLQSLQECTGIKGETDQIFAELPYRSLVIIDNLELWWEKSEQGTVVVKLIADCIEKYSHRFFFIITANNLSYQVINQISPIEQYFLTIVELSPLNAQELQEIIMFRHNSSGFKLKLGHKPNQTLHNSDIARIFSRHFNFSKGNVGDALLSWITNITDFSDNSIFIKYPQSPDLKILEDLQPEILVYLSQFIIHKRLNIEKLQRVTFNSKEEVEAQISFLKRSGIITETAGPIYEINKYLHPFIKNKLFEKNL
jgi:hypothetical protein